MKKRFTILIAAIAAIMMMALPGKAVGQTKDPILLFHETFGSNSGSAAAWNATTYSVQSGEEEVYEDAEYTVTNAKVSKNTMGQTDSGLVSGQGTTGSIIIGPLDVSSYSNIEISYYFGMSASSWNTTYSYVKLSYLGNNNTYVELTRTDSNGNPSGAVSNHNNYKQAVYSLPAAAISDELNLKFEFYCYQINKNNQEIGQAYFDEINMTGIESTPTPTTYTVSFDCDDGTANCPEDIEDLEEGDDFTIPSTAPTKNCYTFGGWFDDELNEYELGETYQCPASDLTLTADWALDKYTVTYYSNNGETDEDVADDNLECGSDYTIADDPGFTQPQATPHFVNWNTQANGQGTTYTVGQVITISGNLSLYAQWSAVATYTVTYAPGTGATGSNVVDNNVSGSYTVRANDGENGNPAFSKEGYTFKCWNNGSNDVNAGSNITVSSNVTLTAQWLENLANPTFTVTGVSNGTANTYYATANVTIQAANGATIYYTTDGTDPTTSSSVYSSAITINTAGTNTIKAFATKAGNGPSAIASQTVIIVNRADATFTNGDYSESFNSSLGLWYAYSVFGNYKWGQGTPATNYTGANINGYSENADNEDWLISPKMTVLNGKLDVIFKTAARYSGAAMVVKYSTDYNGYGNPNNFTWTNLAPSLSTNTGNSFSGWTDGKATISGLSENANVYVAFKYTSAYHSAKQYVIKDFSAKQCYPITYYANGGSGTTADANSPYAVGTEVTILECGFTAPSGKEFTIWNNQANGQGSDDKNPGQKITMTTAGYELYAQWGDACVQKAEMNATTSGGAVYDYNGGEKRFNITPSSSVKAHGGCDIYEYGFVYSTTEENPTIADTKVVVGETQPAVATAFNTTITNVTKGATYYVRSYATNAAGTAYSDVISIAVPANFDNYRYQISYTTNGTAEASTYVYQGAPISGLATPTPANIPSGYTFMGWYGDNYELNNTAPTFVKNGDNIGGNITLRAVFAIAGANNSTTGELTNSEITSNITNSTCAYGTEKTYNDTDDGIKWIASCWTDVNSRPWMQIKKDDASAYIKIEASDKITNVEVLMTSTSNSSGGIADITKHTAFSGTVYLTTSAGTSSTGNVGSMSSSNFDGNTASINPTGNNSTLYIQVTGGAARIWGISVTYGGVSYSSYCTSVTALYGDLSEASTSSGNAYYISAAANVPADKTATINGALGNGTASNLVIHNGGQLVLADNNSLKATVEKTITAPTSWSNNNNTGWYAISSPVGNIAPSSVTYMTLDPLNNIPQYDLYKYVENMGWYNAQAQNQSISTLENGNGYLYARSIDATLSFAGTVSTTGFSLTNLSKSEVKHSGLHLIGNPYTHDIYLGTAITGTNLNTDSYYALDANGLWQPTLNTVAIKPMQAVFVFVTNATNTINFSNEPHATRAHHDYIRFTVANSQYEDVAYAMFDKGYGLNKIEHRNSEAPMLYIPQNDDNYAIAMMEDVTKMFNLSFKAATTGRYTLSFDTQGEYNYLHVIDRLTGEDVDMLLEGEYSFIGSPNDNENRFVVKLAYKPDYSEGNNEIFAFQSGSDILISGEGELQVFDVMGRFVMSERINGATSISADELSKGVYVLRIVGTEIKTQKIVVR